MDTDRLNRWLTLGANIGVLIGIILLVIELDQSRDMMRAQIRNELSRGVYDLMSLAVGNEKMADVLTRANRGEELTPTDMTMLVRHNEATFRYWENAHYQYRQGMYDEEEFSRHLITMDDVMSANPSYVRFWCSARLHYSAPFMEEIDKMLTDEKC